MTKRGPGRPRKEAKVNGVMSREGEIASEVVQKAKEIAMSEISATRKDMKGTEVQMSSQSETWAEKVEEAANRPESSVVRNPNLIQEGNSTDKGKPSYASVVNTSSSSSKGWQLQYVKPQSEEGKVVITKSELEMGSASWENTLVGVVVGRKPGYMEMKKYAQNTWRLEQPKFSLLGNGVCLFTFSTVEQKQVVLRKGWTSFGWPLILKQWEPRMDLENVSFTRVPVWIRFPRLYLSLWNPVSIGKIASYVGKPIGTNEPTANRERMDFARVLVEV